MATESVYPAESVYLDRELRSAAIDLARRTARAAGEKRVRLLRWSILVHNAGASLVAFYTVTFHRETEGVTWDDIQYRDAREVL
jgi:hypothetical protein